MPVIIPNYRSLFATCSLCLCACSNSPDVSPLGQHISAAGYVMYYPARSNWGPGTVLTGSVINNRLSNVQEICTSLYSNLTPSNNNVALSSFQASQNHDLSLGIDLLGKVLGPDKSAKLGLSGKNAQDIDVSFGPSFEDSISGEGPFQNDGKPKRIKPACEAKLKDLKAKGALENSVFVITRALRSGINYDFGNDAEFKTNATLSITSKIGANAGAGWGTNGRTKLIVDGEAGLYLGAAKGGMISLTSWLPSDTISDGYYISTFETVNFDSISLQE